MPTMIRITNPLFAKNFRRIMRNNRTFTIAQHSILKVFPHPKNNPMSIQELGLSGRHTTYSSLAAGIVTHIYDIHNERIRESLCDLKSTEHKQQLFLTQANIDYIDDSKSTNVNSTWLALENATKPVIWIAGGIDKGNDYSIVHELVKKKVKGIVLLGPNTLKLQHHFVNTVPIMMRAESMKEAVHAARLLAKSGDIVLLSPACASFDLFENYEDRGRQFQTEVCAA